MSSKRQHPGTAPAKTEIDLTTPPPARRSTDQRRVRPASKPSGFGALSGSSRLSGRVLALIALVAGVAIGVAAYSINRVNTTNPEAVAPLILDENEVHWPFYRASHDLAQSILEDPATLSEAAARLTDPAEAVSLRIEATSDLSILSLVATATTEESARALASAGAETLVHRSQADRQSSLGQDLEAIEVDIARLERDQAAIGESLDSSTTESEQIRLSSDLRSTSDALNGRRAALEELNNQIESTNSAFIFLAPSRAKTPPRQSLLASLAAGAGAAVLALLLMSFFTAPADEA